MFDKIAGYRVLVVGAVAALFAYKQKVKADTKREVQAETNEQILEIIENADRIEDEIDGLSDDDVRRRLLRDYGRD